MKVNKWLVIAIAVSLGINLMLIGYLAGKEVNSFSSFDPTRGFSRWARTLPEPRREALLPKLTQKTQKRGRVGLRHLHREFRSSLTAEPFDSAKLEQTLAKLRNGHSSMIEANHQTFVEFVGSLSAEERRALAQDLSQKPPRRGRPQKRQHNRQHRAPNDR